jgi:DNA-binding CsgD family transcriptional regulator/PAS domain-containing protein
MAKCDFEQIEHAFADAAIDSQQWVKALETVATVTESAGAILLPIQGDLIPNVPFTERIGESAEDYFQNSWHLRDERNRGIHILVQRGVVDDLDLFTSDEIKRHPYYQEFLAPHHLRWFAGVRVASGDDLWCLSIQRTIEQGPFSQAEKTALGRFSNRLSSSAALARALSAATAMGVLDAFEVSGKAVVLIDRHGEVFKANPSAERLLKGDVRIVKRKLIAKDARATAELDRALHDLLWRRSGSCLSSVVSLPRVGQRPLLAHPIRLSRLAANALADCQAAVILVDPNTRSHPSESSLRAAFQLTSAEARLAARLTAGASLESAAERLGIAKETARNQLKSIFSKIGIHRQAELVAVLASLEALNVGDVVSGLSPVATSNPGNSEPRR